MAGRTIRDSDGNEIEWEPWMDPFPGVTDRASARKYVEDAMAEATPEEHESLARAFLGDKYDEWKRLEALAERGPAALARQRT